MNIFEGIFILFFIALIGLIAIIGIVVFFQYSMVANLREWEDKKDDESK